MTYAKSMLVLFGLLVASWPSVAVQAEKPNVLLIAIVDLSDALKSNPEN
ncbi:hypothetical protein NZK35_18350 [Stieleria sp. ICT_E10.1]|nr:hypothetical protein [Stieleria sedimenti]MCS7468618.1 hypothetical protein [Stieleria sedimenti]